MNLIAILQNKVLIAVLIGWLLAQALKIPTEYLRSRRWMWAMFFAAGGMPSSHSALLVSGTWLWVCIMDLITPCLELQLPFP